MSWKPIDENAPTDEWHLRGTWVRRQLPGDNFVMEWQFALGHIDDEGEFVDLNGYETGWSADDYSHWSECEIPAPPPQTPI